MNDRMRVGAKCRELRKAQGLSMLALAGRTGLSLCTIQAIERAGRVTRRTAELLAAVFKVKPGDLMPKGQE
jgi:transcriptional regulator with XRE-family HTH domain